MIIYSDDVINEDDWGYYDKKLLSYYPKSREWQYRDEYPFQDSFYYAEAISPNDWQDVDSTINEGDIYNKPVKTPEEFQKDIEIIKEKYKVTSPNLWEDTTENIKH